MATHLDAAPPFGQGIAVDALRTDPHDTGHMITHLAVSTAMVLATVAIHGLGLALLGRLLRGEAQAERMHHIPALSIRSLFFTLFLVVAIFTLHGVEIWLYAALYLVIGAIPTLETAVYYSTISYAAIGYDDRYIDPAWRLVAGIEGINGSLLLAWSMAFFVAIVSRLGRT